ncbi:MAG: hypothetical protein QOH41_770 [Blastocatellia bacterium]|nr:hypothetical protein [Blastocatellia bacterium]
MGAKQGKTEHWAYEELRKRLEEKTESWVPHLQDASQPKIGRVTKVPDHELGHIFLMDPRLRVEQDEVLLQRIYPHILETMDGQPLVVPGIEKIQGTIQDGREWEASRVVTFLMEDPARPVLRNDRPLWYFRFTLSVRLLTYMLSSNCSISIPFAAAGPWLLDVLADYRIQEAAPHLSTDEDEFVLSVSSGSGQTFLGEDWKEPIAARFTGHLGVAESVDRFERDPHNYILRSQMLEALASTYPERLRRG